MDPFEQEIDRAIETAGGASRPRKAAGRAGRSPARILLAAPPSEHDQALIRDLEARGDTCIRVERLDQALLLLKSDSFELLLLSPSLEDDFEALRERLQETAPAMKVIVFSPRPTAQNAISAMRFGAVDFFHMPIETRELAERIDAALEKSRADQRRENRLLRLKAICRELNTARREIAEQLDSLCSDMVSAYQGMNEQINDIAMASEFKTLIRQELDIEDVLRTALEYMLTKTGPTNAAVFLGEGGDTYSLGAYVNYDCPRETIAGVLERLGSAVCAQMAEESEIVSFEDAQQFAEWLAIDAGMLAESQVIAFSCMHDGECLAVIVLFRAAEKPFDENLAAVIETLRPIFASQLANIMRVHHRAMPSWPKEACDEEEDFDFNDDSGYGFGGLAA